MTVQDKIQNEVEVQFYKNNCRGLALLATGSGKSKIFINILNKERKRWLLVVPTQKLRDRNWKEEFDKWNSLEVYNKYLTICCYKSLCKENLSSYDGVCLDEVHHITENNVKHLTLNKTIKILALTATLPRDLNKQNILFNKLKCKILFNLPLKEAIRLKIVAPLNIYIHNLNLSTEKNILVSYKDKVTGENKTFYQSEQDKYNYINSRLSKMLSEGKIPGKFDYLNRARFLFESETKVKYARKLLERFHEKKVLVFSQSIPQIENILKEVFHSKTNDKYYNLFVKNKIYHLGVVESLNEGENIDNLDIGLIVQFNSNELALMQRIGRIIRKRKDHIADIHILVFKNTIDEVWANDILAEYKDLITYIN